MTVREIAEQFGVAPSTVSVVLNNRPGVRKELRKKISEALIENGYSIKNKKEETSSKQNTNVKSILFVYYKSTDYLAAREDSTLTSFLEGIESACKESGFMYTVSNASPDNIENILLSAKSNGYDGILLLGTEYYGEPLDAMFNLDIPLVFLDRYFPEYPISTVNMDNRYGIRQILLHLMENGHKKIGYLKSSIEFGCLRDRAACVFQDMEQLGLGKPSCLIEVSQEIIKIRDELTEVFKTLKEMPTAFISDNDNIGVAAVQVLQSMGYSIPEDISVVGYDDSSICAFVIPHLTTVRADLKEMARLATKTLINEISNPSEMFTHLTCGTTFIKRMSSGPAKA